MPASRNLFQTPDPGLRWGDVDISDRRRLRITTRLTRIVGASALLLMTGASPALAQSDLPERGPGLYPELAVTAFYDDNLLRTETNTEADGGVVLAPALTHLSLIGKHSLELNYYGAFARHLDRSDEDYNDNDLNADLRLDLSPAIDVAVEGEYLWSHDARGASGARPVQGQTLDRWTDRRLGAELLFGRRTHRAQLGFAMETSSRQYTNNLQEARDRDALGATATFYYNLTAKTAALVELDRTEIDYTRPAPVNLDSTETRLALGLRWEATRQTTGAVRVGGVRKALDDATLQDFSGGYVAGDVVWEPRIMDRVSVALSRRPYESAQSGASYYVANRVAVSWEHQLTELIAFGVDAAAQRDAYSDGRSDDLRQLGLLVSVDLTERLDIEGRYEFNRRDSDLTAVRYDANLVLLALRMQAF